MCSNQKKNETRMPPAYLHPCPHKSPHTADDQLDLMLDPGIESSHAQTSLSRALDSQVGSKLPELVREKATGLKVSVTDEEPLPTN